MKSASVYILSLTLLFLGVSCARVGNPDGGPEDETPPTLVESLPADGTINFTGNVIELAFDERVVTRSIETDLIITPKPEGTFISRTNKNRVALTFSEGFNPNTTYSVNFGNTIQDITNNNPATGINLSFSTGDYIDSLSVQGKVLNLYSQEPIENLLVTLYKASDSLDVLSGPASYYSRTDTAGNYSFTNLPNESFRLYAVRDKNSNSKGDSETETYGFYQDTIRLTESIQDIDFTIQNLDTRQLRTLSSRPFGKYYEITFNKAVDSIKFQSTNVPVYDQIQPDKIRFYKGSIAYSDTTDLIFSVSDSLGQTLLDTAAIYFVDSKIKAPEFSVSVSPSDNLLSRNDTLRLTFNKPAIHLNPDSLYVSLDSIRTQPIDTTNLLWNKLRTRLAIPISINDYLSQTELEQVTLTIGKAAFISSDNDTSKLITQPLALLTPENSAVISGTVQSSSNNIIVQLLEPRNFKVLKTSRSKDFKFEYLRAGSYMVRIIKDLNGNGYWDIGNINQWLQPEPAKFYFDSFTKTKIIQVRKNWEQSEVDIFF